MNQPTDEKPRAFRAKKKKKKGLSFSLKDLGIWSATNEQYISTAAAQLEPSSGIY
jgi:hypothetical protein